MPQIKRNMLTPIDPERNEIKNRVPRLVKPTRVTYVDALEKKYAHLFSEKTTDRHNGQTSEVSSFYD